MKLQKLKPLSALLAAVLLTACSAEEEQAKLIENSEYTDVKVTVKNIRLYCENNGTTFSKSADLTDIKLI